MARATLFAPLPVGGLELRNRIVTVGLISEFEQAKAILEAGDADLIGLARAILYNPRWPWRAAAHFGATVAAPNQYLRSQPARHRDLLVGSPAGPRSRT